MEKDTESAKRYIEMREVTYADYVEFIKNHKKVKIEDTELEIGGKKKIKQLQPANFEPETTTVWSFPNRGNWATHYLNARYRGNWAPEVARNLILKYTQPGDTVMDQMVGSGTTAIECKLLGRNCIAVDINPDAIMVTRDRLDFSYNTPDPNFSKVTTKTYVGGARNLNLIKDESIDLIAISSKNNTCYFLIAVSNKENLDLCIKYSIAGFPNTINGFWTFCEIKKGDFVSFLYGARVFNLYKVVDKCAFKEWEKLPPWKPLVFRKKIYYFPFRLILKPIRELNESMVRPEFSYIAENLLLRGGYRKTHFQADMSTFYGVSQMGEIWKKPIKSLKIDADTFTPFISFTEKSNPPRIFRFHEFILQALIRHYFSIEYKLQNLLNLLDRNLNAEEFEVLGEKAFPEGHVDIFIKDIHPKGTARKIVMEVKKSKIKKEDILQLKEYMKEIKEECIGGIIIAGDISQKLQKLLEKDKIYPLVYRFSDIEKGEMYGFEDLLKRITLETPEGERV